MALEELSRLLNAFYDRKIDDLSLYVEGFGGFFLSRTKDGVVIGYIDEDKRFGIDDHVTFLFDLQEVKGMHRKVIDENNVVYIKYNIDYFRSPDGIKKLLQDLQRRNDVPLSIKILLVPLYWILNWAFNRGMRYRSLKILVNSEARKLGMKPPCIYVKPGYTERFLLPIYNWIIRWQKHVIKRKFGKRTSDAFREQRYPGSHVTKYPKRKTR